MTSFYLTYLKIIIPKKTAPELIIFNYFTKTVLFYNYTMNTGYIALTTGVGHFA